MLHGDASANYGLSTWLTATYGELELTRRLARLIASPVLGLLPWLRILPVGLAPRLADTAELLFITQGCGTGGWSRQHAQYNELVRQAVRWSDKYNGLVDYHNIEQSHLNDAVVSVLLASMTSE